MLKEKNSKVGEVLRDRRPQKSFGERFKEVVKYKYREDRKLGFIGLLPSHVKEMMGKVEVYVVGDELNPRAVVFASEEHVTPSREKAYYMISFYEHGEVAQYWVSVAIKKGADYRKLVEKFMDAIEKHPKLKEYLRLWTNVVNEEDRWIDIVVMGYDPNSPLATELEKAVNSLARAIEKEMEKA